MKITSSKLNSIASLLFEQFLAPSKYTQIHRIDGIFVRMCASRTHSHTNPHTYGFFLFIANDTQTRVNSAPFQQKHGDN